jgi:hypothetical protein
MTHDPYLEYLARFESEVGAIAVGGYGKWKGKLVRKLAPDEFQAKHDEYVKLLALYTRSLSRGDTLNDTLTKLLMEHSGELVRSLDADLTAGAQ